MTKSSDFSPLKWGIAVGLILSITLFVMPWRSFMPEAYQKYTNNWTFQFEAYSHPRIYNHNEQLVLLNPGQKNKVVIVDKNNGQLLWEAEIGNLNSNVAPPVFQDGKLCLLADKLFKIWDLSSGELLQTFDFSASDTEFDYYNPPIFWTSKDSLIIESINNSYLKIGEKDYSLLEKAELVTNDQKILWMKGIAAQDLKKYNLANFKKMPLLWYNFQDSVFIDWDTLGTPLRVVSDSQLIIYKKREQLTKFNYQMTISKWHFKKDSIEWMETLGNRTFERLVYHKTTKNKLWLLWKQENQAAIVVLDLQTGKKLKHSISSKQFLKPMQHQETCSFTSNYQRIYWISWEESTIRCFKEYRIEDFKSITTTMDEKVVYIVSEKREEDAPYTEPRIYELKSFDRKNIE